MSEAFEINLDGIVGPTHNYAGLSFGNIASQKHALSQSNPKQAALQGLAKMRFLHDLGVRQAVLPPHPRPHFLALRRVGFMGSDAKVLARVQRDDPRLLAAIYSASAMWTANAATVSPGADANDGRVHFTPANLITQFHRSLEAPVTAELLRAIFPDEAFFAHHEPLPAADAFADEGAANHMRMCAKHGEPGVELFVYGRSVYSPEASPVRFPARQTLEAAKAIVRRHGVNSDRVILVRQSQQAIDAGAFHNDVVAVSNENVLFCHGSSWDNMEGVLDELRDTFWRSCGMAPFVFVVHPTELSLNDAIETYLFNSQIVTLLDGMMSLIAPIECRDHPRVQQVITKLLQAGGPVRSAHYLDVRQSMRNGGGPACLRLRVCLTAKQFQQMHPHVHFTPKLHELLIGWVERHYRDSISIQDLADPSLARESDVALKELFRLLTLEIPSAPIEISR